MTRPILAAAVVVLAGCTLMPDKDKRAGTRAAPYDPRNPSVYVVESKSEKCKIYVIVDQEPAYFFKKDHGKDFKITWTLETDGFSFVDEDVSDPKEQGPSPRGEIFKCHAIGKKMSCINKGVNTGTWKYTLNVQRDDDNKKDCPDNPPKLDPTIAND